MRCDGRFLLAALVAVLLALAAPAAARTDTFAEHVERGRALYEKESYEDAIREFQAAYAIKQLPRLLFNIGQAHLKLGHAREALDYYDRYKRVAPKLSAAEEAAVAAQSERARALIAEAERMKAGPQATGTTETTSGTGTAGTQAQPGRVDLTPRATEGTGQPEGKSPAIATVDKTGARPVEPIEPKEKDRPVYKKWWFWGAIGGVVVAGAAVGTGVALSSRGPSYDDLPVIYDLMRQNP